MKTIITVILAVATFSATAQEKVIEPESITPMPKVTKTEWQKYFELYDQGLATKDTDK